MVEEHGNEMGEGQDSMCEDAALTIGMEWDDWSSATHRQSITDEVLADALRKGNTDLSWNFDFSCMKKESQARKRKGRKLR